MNKFKGKFVSFKNQYWEYIDISKPCKSYLMSIIKLN